MKKLPDSAKFSLDLGNIQQTDEQSYFVIFQDQYQEFSFKIIRLHKNRFSEVKKGPKGMQVFFIRNLDQYLVLKVS